MKKIQFIDRILIWGGILVSVFVLFCGILDKEDALAVVPGIGLLCLSVLHKKYNTTDTKTEKTENLSFHHHGQC